MKCVGNTPDSNGTLAERELLSEAGFALFDNFIYNRARLPFRARSWKSLYEASVMNRFKFTIIASSFLLASVCFAQQKTLPAQKPAAKTQLLLTKWIKEAEKAGEYFDSVSEAHQAAWRELLKEPDADLALLSYLESKEVTNAGAFVWCCTELGKLNSQRTFDVVLKRLKSGDMGVRIKAIHLVADFSNRRERVPLLVHILENDPKREVRSFAIDLVANLKDRNAEPALIRAMNSNDSWMWSSAARALAEFKSEEGLSAVIGRLSKVTDDQERAYLIDAIAGYRRKAIIKAVLKQYSRTPKVSEIHMGRVKFAPDGAGSVQLEASEVMKECFELADKINGPQPDDFYEQWQEWWDKTEPLLTDDLKLKVPLTAGEVKFGDADFGHDPNDLQLEIAVDSESFRYRDPIRLDLTFTNKTDKPYRVILPKPPFMFTMGYGIQLECDGKRVIDGKPPDFYLGSYFGPPDFETLAPREVFRYSVCLQYFLRSPIRAPLPNGDYQFTLTFDSAKFAHVQPKGAEMTGSWTAKPVTFKVEGEARTDTKEIFELIAKKARLPYLRTDFHSASHERRDRAKRVLFEYCDKRLAADDSMPGWIRTDLYIRD